MNRSGSKKANKINGFTMIELLIVVSILGTLIALAMPSFQNTIEAATTNSQVKTMLTTLNLARSEAIKRGDNVHICASEDGADCDAGSWTEGWLVFHDANGDANGAAGSVDAGDTIVRVFDTLGSASTIAFSTNLFTYNRLGFNDGGAAETFNVTPSSGIDDNKRCLFIGLSGRGRRAEGTDCP